MALKYLNQYISKTLSGAIDNSTTAITLSSSSGLETTKAGIALLSWSDPLDTSICEWITYTSINGSNELQGVVRGQEGYSAKSHLNGAIVAFPLSKSHVNELNDAVIALQANPVGVLTATQYAPSGFLINGKIVPSVASNNLTVALKGLDGNDPSASNPVYVRIGDTVRTITSALSVTKNAGTNYFGSGATKFATYERDYFVYLGYNATDGTTIGFSPIPYANIYSEFSTTATAETYCAISTTTNATASDAYEVVGRFGATLSAGAGYTWSVPTFTATNLVQKPIHNTRVLTYLPTVTCSGSMTWSVGTPYVRQYHVVGNSLHFDLKLNGTLGGTAHSLLYIEPPFAAKNAADLMPTFGYAYVYTGSGLDCYSYYNVGAITVVKTARNNFSLGATDIEVSGNYVI